MQNQPTPYSQVNEILNLLQNQVISILGSQMTGMYLYGSLSSGDFNLHSSDIDFVVITETSLSSELVSSLESMHGELWASGKKWAKKLEGAYVPKSLMRHNEPTSSTCPTVNESAFYMGQIGSDWIIHRHVVREYGVVISGPDPKTLIDPVSTNEIRQAVRGVLDEWWFPMLDNPSWLGERGSEYHAYAVISICRALHALEHGTIVSKPVAAHWVKERLGSPWNELIEKALVSQQGGQPGFLQEALDFIKFAEQIVNPPKIAP